LNGLISGNYSSNAALKADELLLELQRVIDPSLQGATSDVSGSVDSLNKATFGRYALSGDTEVKGVVAPDRQWIQIGNGKLGIIEVRKRSKVTVTASEQKEVSAKKNGRRGRPKPKVFWRTTRFDKLLLLLSDVRAVPFQFDSFRAIPKVDELYLKPYDIRDWPEGEDRQMMRIRAGREGNVGGFLTLSTTLMALRCTFPGSGGSALRILGMLKYYRSWLGEEPGRRMSSGVVVTNKDVLSSVRILTLLSAYFHISSLEFYGDEFKRDVITDIAMEALLFIFNDPYSNTKKWASYFKGVRNFLGCRSNTGKKLVWNGPKPTPGCRVYGYSVADASVDHTDSIMYGLHQKDVQKAIQECALAGLPKLSSWLSGVVTAPSTKQFLREYVFIEAIQGWAGFTRSFLPTALKGQSDYEIPVPDWSDKRLQGVKEVVEERKTQCNDEHPWSDNLDRNVREMFEYSKGRKGSPLTYPEWLRTIPGMLTSSSPGSQPHELASAESRAFGIIAPSRNIPESDKRPFKLRAKSRAARFMIDPSANINKNEFVNLRYTANDPGSFGWREVPGGKASRLVNPQKNIYYFCEKLFENFLKPAAFSNTRGNYVPFKTAYDFHYAVETGVIVQTFGWLLVATSANRWLIEMADFSTLDASLKYATFRRYVKRTIIRYIQENGWDGPWGDKNAGFYFEGGLVEILEILWGKNHVYDVHRQVRVGRFTTMLVLDMVLSGELLTSILDSIATKANFQMFIELMTSSNALKWSLNSFNILGDDFLAIFEIPKPISPGDVEVYTLARRMMAAENNLTFRPDAVLMRSELAEYLKKTFWRGFYLPRNLLQLFASEKDELIVDPVERLRSFRSLIGASVARGLPHVVGTRFLMHVWNLHRGIKAGISRSQRSEDSVQIWYHYPYDVIHLPLCMKGIGMYPYTVLGANLDAVIAFRCQVETNGLKESFRASAFIMQVDRSTFMRKIIGKIVSGETVPIKAFGKGEKFIRTHMMQENVLNAAVSAMDGLRSRKLPTPGNLFYGAMPRRMIAPVVESIKELRLMSTEVKRFIIDAALRTLFTEKRKSKFNFDGTWQSKFGWLTSLVPNYLHQFEELKDEPNLFWVLDDRISAMYRHVGPAMLRDDDIFSLEELAKLMAQDSNLDRALQPEAVMRYISNPAFIRDIEALPLALKAIGFNDKSLATIMSRFRSLRDRMFVSQIGDLISYNDSFLPNMDLRLSNLKRFVSFPHTADAAAKNLFTKVGFLDSLIQYVLTGKWSFLKWMADDESLNRFGGHVYRSDWSTSWAQSARIFGSLPMHITRNWRRE
jgi:hypothetical protein